MKKYYHVLKEEALLPQMKHVQLLVKEKQNKTWATGDINCGSLLREQRTGKSLLRSVTTEM